MLSDHGSTNPREWFAETFVHLYINGISNPQASLLDKFIKGA